MVSNLDPRQHSFSSVPLRPVPHTASQDLERPKVVGRPMVFIDVSASRNAATTVPQASKCSDPNVARDPTKEALGCTQGPTSGLDLDQHCTGVQDIDLSISVLRADSSKQVVTSMTLVVRGSSRTCVG